MSMTTIRVQESVRDKINEIAAAQGTSAGSVIEALLEEHIERTIMDEVRRKMQSMTAEEQAEYENEVALWDRTSGDGLEEYAGEYDQEWAEILAKDPNQIPNYRAHKNS